MMTDSKAQPTFSARRRWSARLAVLIATMCVVAIIGMVNRASQRYFSKRWFLSDQTEVQLSPQTLGLLKGLTNDIAVTLFYDREEPMFSTVASLLNEYRLNSRHVRVKTVDYLRNPAEAAEVKVKHNLPSVEEQRQKDLVIFECEGRTKVVPANLLVEYTLEHVASNGEQMEFQKKPVLFMGEQVFSAVILGVTSPKPLKACFLQGHDEHLYNGGDEQMGFLEFSNLLRQNHLQVVPATLLGTNQLPEDCSLLVIAGPTDPLPEVEVEKVERYLDQGGRALVLFNYLSTTRRTGLESVLGKWGVAVGAGVVRDEQNTVRGPDLMVGDFGSHPIMNPLLRSAMHLVLPRPVGPLSTNGQPADAPEVEVLASSAPTAELVESITSRKPGQYPLAVAVERSVKGVVTERGSTRLVVVGDSIFLGNEMIESAGNRDFASAAINWLLDRPTLLEGVGPKRVSNYRLLITDSQMRKVEWVLLGALPLGLLAVGGLVWLRRRS